MLFILFYCIYMSYRGFVLHAISSSHAKSADCSSEMGCVIPQCQKIWEYIPCQVKWHAKVGHRTTSMASFLMLVLGDLVLHHATSFELELWNGCVHMRVLEQIVHTVICPLRSQSTGLRDLLNILVAAAYISDFLLWSSRRQKLFGQILMRYSSDFRIIYNKKGNFFNG